MSDAPLAKVSHSVRLPLVWLVPLAALAVAAWMIYREFGNRGPEITIEFADGAGIEPGKTTLQYQGVIAGLVKDVRLKDDLGGVLIRLRLAKTAAALARDGSLFWVVQPEIGVSGISGLDTLLSGVHLNVRPGEGPPVTRFRGLDTPPAPEAPDEGRAFILLADRLGTLEPRAPVMYREVKVGEVETSSLADDATRVWIRIRIFNPYVDLVRANTHFWNAGGVPVKFGLLGGEIQTASLGALLTGAIAFATPEEAADPAPEGAQFELHAELNRDWLDWRPSIPIAPEEIAPEPEAKPDSLPELLGR
ncbi:MAG: MlaD family protein [Opitutaceae bacterium]